MRRGFVVSAVLYPLLILGLSLMMIVLSMSDNRRKVLENLKLEVSEESDTDPEMSNSALYYKMQALEEAYAEMSSRLSEDRLEELKEEIKEETLTKGFPIGSIFTSTTNTNPASYIGGTWEAYGEGRTLVGEGSGTDSNDTTRSFTAGTTGGEYTHTLSTAEIPIHSHTIPSLSGTAASAGEHVHTINATVGATAPSYSAPLKFYSYALGPTTGRDTLRTGITAENGSHTHDVTTMASVSESAGESGSHNNIQPYITVYFWKRTA